jgi:hypothetical protein
MYIRLAMQCHDGVIGGGEVTVVPRTPVVCCGGALGGANVAFEPEDGSVLTSAASAFASAEELELSIFGTIIVVLVCCSGIT